MNDCPEGHDEARKAVRRLLSKVPLEEEDAKETIYHLFVQAQVNRYLELIKAQPRVSDPRNGGSEAWFAEARQPLRFLGSHGGVRKALRKLAADSETTRRSFDVAKELVARLLERHGAIPVELRSVAAHLTRGKPAPRVRPKDKRKLFDLLICLLMIRALDAARAAGERLTPTRNDEKVRDSAADIVADGLAGWLPRAGIRRKIGYAGVKKIWMEWRSRPDQRTRTTSLT